MAMKIKSTVNCTFVSKANKNGFIYIGHFPNLVLAMKTLVRKFLVQPHAKANSSIKLNQFL